LGRHRNPRRAQTNLTLKVKMQTFLNFFLKKLESSAAVSNHFHSVLEVATRHTFWGYTGL
jgi:hypothetical protein